MTENQFDELFRNKLQDYSSQVPDNMWERIHKGKDRDRKLFFIWLKYVIVPAFTLAGLAGAYYIGTRPAAHHSLSHSSASIASAPVFSPDSPIVSGSYTVTSGSAQLASGNSTVSSGNTEVSGNREVPGAHSSIAPTGTLISAIPPSVPIPTRNTNSASNPAIQHMHRTSKTIYPSAPSASTPADPLSAPASRLSDAHNSSKASTFRPSDASVPLSSLRSSAIPSSPANADNTANADNALKHLPLPGIQPIPNTRLHPVIDQLSKTTFSPVKKTATPPPGPKNNFLSPLKKGSWSVDLYASPDLPVIQLKQDFEKSQLSFTIGVKVNRSFGDHVSAATGMQYSQLNEKVAYNDSSITNPIRYRYLKRTSFDFPFLIGYGIGDDRFRATLNAGMIFKIHSFGDLYTTSNSLYLGVNLAKKINDKISFFAEPYYRYNLPGGGNQYYTQRINLAGISVGLRYNFKKSGRHKQYDTGN